MESYGESPVQASKDFRVAIIGGGMCGLACAVGLARAGIHADLFEATAKFEEVGAGVGLGPNALRALDDLGILSSIMNLLEASEHTDRRMLFVSGPGDHQVLYDYRDSPDCGAQDGGVGIYRPTFLDAVLPLIPDPSHMHFKKRLTSISTISGTSAHTIHFSDGTAHEADLVIGADGIHSSSRTFVTGKDNKEALEFTNTVAYRAVVPWDVLKGAGVRTDLTSRTFNFVGIGKHIIAFPIQKRTKINVVAFVTETGVPVGSVQVAGSWVQRVPQQELVEQYADWGPDVQTILQHMEKPSKWFIHHLKPLERYSRDRVVLVGDAAHAMCPHLGSGVGQGFEDVFLLCKLLGHPQTNLSNLQSILAVYDCIRRPRAEMVWNRSFAAGLHYERCGLPGYQKNDMQSHFQGVLDPIWRHDLGADVAAAVAELINQGIFTETSG